MSNQNLRVKAKELELATRPPLPVLVCRNGVIVGDAVVIVSPRDPNWYRNDLGGKLNGEIRVRRVI
jgi:hypothetical protein